MPVTSWACQTKAPTDTASCEPRFASRPVSVISRRGAPPCRMALAVAGSGRHIRGKSTASGIEVNV